MEALASSVTIPKFPEPYSPSLFRKPTKRTGFLRINDCSNFVGLRALSGESEEAKPSENGFGFFSEEDVSFEDISFTEVSSLYSSMDTQFCYARCIYSCKRRPYKYAIRVLMQCRTVTGILLRQSQLFRVYILLTAEPHNW